MKSSKIKNLEQDLSTLLSAIKEAIPQSEYPTDDTIDSWAWQIRNLGLDWKYLKEKPSQSQLYDIKLLYLEWYLSNIDNIEYFNKMAKLIDFENVIVSNESHNI